MTLLPHERYSFFHLRDGVERSCLNRPSNTQYPHSTSIPLSRAACQLQPQGRRYSLRDCGIVCLIVVGLATFMNAETRSSAESETPTSLLGVACISLALVIDAANINIQVR